MESSRFSDEQPRFESMEPVDSNGATCDTFRVKLYGKLHFLKRLKPAFANDIRYQEAFQKEFETGYRLEHPHIVRYVSLSDEGILMEYVDGETLKQRIDSHPEYFNKKNSEKLLRQLLDAVGYLHAHQVLHLDLKPDNIMLTRIGNDVKLVDLGFCYTDTFVDTQGRTDRFAAPEQLTVGNVDERTDIYALGRIIEQLPKHNIYNKVIARCVAQTPKARYQVVDDLRNAIFPKKKNWLLYIVGILISLLLFVSLFWVNNHRTSVGTGEVSSVVHKEKPETIKVVNHVEPAEQLKSNDEVSSTQSMPDAQPIKRELTEEEKEFYNQYPHLRALYNKEASSTKSIPDAQPIKKELTEEEKEFINQPHLRIISSEEFERYKQQLDEYFSEANAFLNDSTNFQKYPSHVAYLGHFQEIIHRTLERIKADEWFSPLYKSPLNPVSSYTRKYYDDLDYRAFLNSNKLP